MRCDGATTHGQCTALLYDCWPAQAALDPHGAPTHTPVLAERPNLVLSDRGVEMCDWLLTRDRRVLCPDHVRALEKQAAAELDGLPFGE